MNKEILSHYNKLVNLSKRYNNYNIFKDFINLSAYAYRNLANKISFNTNEFNEIEEKYLALIKKYSKEAIDEMVVINGLLTQEMLFSPSDVIGELYMNLDLGDVKGFGQCFTPFNVSELMASLTYNEEEIERSIKENKIISIDDCACGSGCTLIAAFKLLVHEKKLSVDKVILTGTDIDEMCFYMFYLQASAMGAAAIITNGNALNLDVYKRWETPAYSYFNMIGKYKKDKINEQEKTTKEESNVIKISLNSEQLSLF